jgi:hypothetical protein
MSQFLSGAVAATALAIAVFFFRYYRDRRDRLFGYFGLSFLVLAVDWAALGLLAADNPFRTHLYLVRLLAFVLILWGIVDKNREA